ncbi:MAG: DUF1730 domain-containing protein [Agriterribacter sp.]
MTPITNSNRIKQIATQLGFDYCGIAQAVPLDDDARRLETWLNKGYNGTMQYMENYFELRVNPQKLVPGAKSVITLLLNYYPSDVLSTGADVPRISKYAWGTDYHEVIKLKLRLFVEQIKIQIGDVNGRGFVDSAPVLERAWAQRSGLGGLEKTAT